MLRTESELEITSHQNQSSSLFGNQPASFGSNTNDLFTFNLFGPSDNAAWNGRSTVGSRGVKHVSDAKKFVVDENTPPQTADVGVIGMEMLSKNQAEKKKIKPSFSFDVAVNNNDAPNSAGEDNSQKTKMNELRMFCDRFETLHCLACSDDR